MRKLFLVAPNGKCFGCGQLILGFVVVNGCEFLMCLNEGCPYETSLKELGTIEVNGRKYNAYVRKVR